MFNLRAWLDERREIASKATKRITHNCYDGKDLNDAGECVHAEHDNFFSAGLAYTRDAKEHAPRLIAALERSLAGLEKAERCGSEGLNGLVRGFVGNAEQDWREQQSEIRAALADISAILEGKS